MEATAVTNLNASIIPVTLDLGQVQLSITLGFVQILSVIVPQTGRLIIPTTAKREWFHFQRALAALPQSLYRSG